MKKILLENTYSHPPQPPFYRGGFILLIQKIEEARAIKNYNQQFSKAIQEEEAVEKTKIPFSKKEWSVNLMLLPTTRK